MFRKTTKTIDKIWFTGAKRDAALLEALKTAPTSVLFIHFGSGRVMGLMKMPSR